jgi:hypothetical protein
MNGNETPLTQDAAPAAVATPSAHPLAAVPLDPIDRLIDATGLRLLLWLPGCQPSLSWLRDETAKGNIPSCRVGKRRWHLPRKVQQSILTEKPRRGPTTNLLYQYLTNAAVKVACFEHGSYHFQSPCARPELNMLGR